jgi:hypothetical protein
LRKRSPPSEGFFGYTVQKTFLLEIGTMKAIPQFNFIDRLMLQNMVSEYTADNFKFISRQGEMASIRNQDYEEYGIRALTDVSGREITVNVVQNDMGLKSQRIKASTLHHNINDYLDTNNPHPVIVMLSYLSITNLVNRNPFDQFHVMHKLLNAMNDLTQRYGQDVFIQARDFDLELPVYINDFSNFSDQSFSPITLIRDIARYAVESVDIEKSRNYIHDLFKGMDYLLKPSERGVFAPKLASLFDAQLRSYQKSDTAYLALLSPVLMQQNSAVKVFDLTSKSDHSNEFFKKVESHVESLPVEIPKIFGDAISPLLSFEGASIRDLLLESSKKLKIGAIKEVLERECSDQGVEAVGENIMHLLLEDFVKKMNKVNYVRSPLNKPYSVVNFHLFNSDNICKNIGVAIAEFDRINPSKESFVEKCINRFDEMVSSAQDIEHKYQLGIAFKILIDAITFEEKRFLKVKDYRPWAIELERVFNKYNSSIEEDESKFAPAMPMALIAQHTERAIAEESLKNDHSINGDDICNHLNESTL